MRVCGHELIAILTQSGQRQQQSVLHNANVPAPELLVNAWIPVDPPKKVAEHNQYCSQIDSDDDEDHDNADMK
jgi:hypothetical protein